MTSSSPSSAPSSRHLVLRVDSEHIHRADSCACCNHGISSRHGPHQLAQMFTSRGRPGEPRQLHRVTWPEAGQRRARGARRRDRPVRPTSGTARSSRTTSVAPDGGATVVVPLGSTGSPAPPSSPLSAAQPARTVTAASANDSHGHSQPCATSWDVLDELGRHDRVGRSLAVRGAEPGDRARPAGRLAGVTPTAAVPDQPVREHRPVLAREQRADFSLDLDRVGLRRSSRTDGRGVRSGCPP